MSDQGVRLGPDDIAVGLDLGSAGHEVVVLTVAGNRLTRFRISHSLNGFQELIRRCGQLARTHPESRAVFACEATGHVWESLASYLEDHGQQYVIVNPLATFRVREARQMNRHKTDHSDAEQVADLLRTGLVTRTLLERGPFLDLRRAWGEFERLRWERARLKTLLSHQLYGLFPEFLSVWSDVLQPGAMAVLRLGLTPHQIAALPVSEFRAAAGKWNRHAGEGFFGRTSVRPRKLTDPACVHS
jgi:transposase